MLVDRFWPRGIPKDKLKIDVWFRDIAPSDKLRKWFSHDAKKWEKFRTKYMEEIRKDSTKLGLLHKLKEMEAQRGRVVLLYSAKDTEHNNAAALKEMLSADEIV